MANKKVVVDLESLPKGQRIEVLYLGVFENGATHDLTDEQVEQYEAASGRKFPESGYLFASKPKTDAQKSAFEKNEEDLKSEKPQKLDPATQIPGGYSDGTDPSVVEGSGK